MFWIDVSEVFLALLAHSVLFDRKIFCFLEVSGMFGQLSKGFCCLSRTFETFRPVFLLFS